MPEVEPNTEEANGTPLPELAQETDAMLQAEAAQELAERLDTLRQLANELDHDRWRLPEGPTTLL